MHLDRLVERENFHKVLKETIEDFLLKIKNRSFLVEFSNKKLAGENYFLINSKLNIIFPKKLSSFKIYPFIRQFFYNPNKFKSILQKNYCKLSLNKFFRKLFYKKTLSISPWEKSFKDLIICGGNHSISIISLKDKTSTQILKYNYNPRFIINSIKIRNKYPELPIPKIYDYSIKENWVKQEWINGIPINRIKNYKNLKESINYLDSAMMDLYKKTKKKEQISEWVLKTNDNIKNSIYSLPNVYDKSIKEEFLAITFTISKLFFKKHSFSKFIYTSITHGDYYGSNIIFADDKKYKNKIFILDWDYVDRRFFMYDFLVYKLNVRSTKELAKTFLKFLKYNIDFNYDQNIFSEFIYDEFETSEILGLFLLEDIYVRFIENQIPNLKKINKDLLNYLSEIKKILLWYEK